MNLFPIDLEQLLAARPGLLTDFTLSLATILVIILAGLVLLACLRKILKNLADFSRRLFARKKATAPTVSTGSFLKKNPC